MANNFAVFTKGALGITLLVFRLAICLPPELSRSKCFDAQVKLLDTKWTLYQNLIRIKLHKCMITKITNYMDCISKKSVRNEETFTYYDTSRSCIDLAREESPKSVTTEYPCLNGNIRKVTETNHATHATGEVNLQTDKLFLPSGFACKYSLGFCYDFNLGGYVWETSIPDDILCNNLIRLDRDGMTVMKFSLDSEYIVFEEETKALAVELIEELDLCGGKVWTDKKGFFVTNDTFFKPESRLHQVYVEADMPQKQRVYEGLVEDCEQNGGVAASFYYYTTIVLLAYVLLHFSFSVYGHLTNCRTFRRERGETCKWLFQSWINRSFMNKSTVTETKLLSDIEMANVSRESCPSYYQLRLPNRDIK
ncbi:uncharacterized protein LOC108907745 [Anoplophora glabripennis]|uniref:uncharacterized protein LOC108907745 n=1 Tax=Anoplophora glabripennis TaxID=217634 RepID=UPI00087356F6|nr:uncharacterized protein LOC108907745 [Anoplophora glabripennis]